MLVVNVCYLTPLGLHDKIIQILKKITKIQILNKTYVVFRLSSGHLEMGFVTRKPTAVLRLCESQRRKSG